MYAVDQAPEIWAYTLGSCMCRRCKCVRRRRPDTGRRKLFKWICLPEILLIFWYGTRYTRTLCSRTAVLLPRGRCENSSYICTTTSAFKRWNSQSHASNTMFPLASIALWIIDMLEPLKPKTSCLIRTAHSHPKKPSPCSCSPPPPSHSTQHSSARAQPASQSPTAASQPPASPRSAQTCAS